MSEQRSVLFICVRNSGKSQMAAGLLAAQCGDRVRIDSAGTEPGTALNPQSVEALAEIGVDISAGTPRPLTSELLAGADHVIDYHSQDFAQVLSDYDLVLDGETKKLGGMGLCRQLKSEVLGCPPVLVLTGRPQDGWLATWSMADAAVAHPLDPIALADAVADLARRVAGR